MTDTCQRCKLPHDGDCKVAFASVRTFVKRNGDVGWSISCRLCRQQGRSWSTEKIAKILVGRHDAYVLNLQQDVMDLWCVHMKVHHSAQPQPDWQLSDDVDDEVFDSDAKTHRVSAEEILLQKIFGEKIDDNPCPVCNLTKQKTAPA